MALDKPGFDEEFQMARDAGLRLAENCHELADREFGFGEKGEQAQTGGFACRRRGNENGVERDVGGHGIPASVRPCKQYADIFICKVIFAAICVTAAFPAWINPCGRLSSPGMSTLKSQGWLL